MSASSSLTPTASPTQSLSLFATPSRSPSPTLTYSNATAAAVSHSTSSLLSTEQITLAVILPIIFVIVIVSIWLWRRRTMGGSGLIDGGLSSRLFSPRFGAATPRNGSGAGASAFVPTSRLSLWAAATTAQISYVTGFCRRAPQPSPFPAGAGAGAVAVVVAGAPVLLAHGAHAAAAPVRVPNSCLSQWAAATMVQISHVTGFCHRAQPCLFPEGGAGAGAGAPVLPVPGAHAAATPVSKLNKLAPQSGTPRQLQGANSFGLRPQIQQPTAAQHFSSSIGRIFGMTQQKPVLRELRANALPINLSSRNFQVSNPLARKT